jgi:hypothetical protein
MMGYVAQGYEARRPSFPRPNKKAKKHLEDVTRPDKSTKEDKMEPGKAVDAGIRVYWLAFVVYWVFYSMQANRISGNRPLRI